MLQDVLVTLVAVGALAVVGRRVLGFVGSKKKGQPACAACPSNAATKAAPRAATVVPLDSLRVSRQRPNA
jgi:hypothetical protein